MRRILAAAALSLVLIFSFSSVAKADSVTELQAQIEMLMSRLRALQAEQSTNSSSGTTSNSDTFVSDLRYGMTNNADVRRLQDTLRTLNFFSGESSGNYFSFTQAAVGTFQTTYGISESSALVGTQTRAKLNSLIEANKTSNEEDVDILAAKATLLGDVDLSGTVTIIDAQQLSRYFAGRINLKDVQLANADMNNDGRVTRADVTAISEAVTPVAATLLGDVDLNSVVNIIDAQQLNRYLAGRINLKDVQLANADMNKDGKVTDADVTAIAAVSTPVSVTLRGDVDLNGTVNITDAQQLSRYLAGRINLKDVQIANADMNKDGTVTTADVTAISEASTPAAVMTLRGDVTLDGVVNIVDAQQITRYLAGSLNLKDVQILNADMNKDGSVTTADSALIAEISTAVISTPVAPTLRGDVDLNGVVNIIDAQQLNRYLAGRINLKDVQLANADMNNDGSVTTADVSAIAEASTAPAAVEVQSDASQVELQASVIRAIKALLKSME